MDSCVDTLKTECSIPLIDNISLVEYNGPIREQHSIFNKFKSFSGYISTAYDVDYIGTITDYNWLLGANSNNSVNTILYQSTLPPVSEEYFEWIDVLSSVYNAKDSYTMIELGAGYGRWAVRSVLAARQHNIKKIHIGLVEAEPVHVSWLKTHLINNQITEKVNIYECAVSDKDGYDHFFVGQPNDNLIENTAENWYGQSFPNNCGEPIQTNIEQGNNNNLTYQGCPVIPYTSGYKAIGVEVRDIHNILTDFEDIDLLDLDVQGEEEKILKHSIAILSSKVKRIHIGTHNSEIEKNLRMLFKKAGWFCLNDYRCGYNEKTPFGEVFFQDGVQTWLNPKFEHILNF